MSTSRTVRRAIERATAKQSRKEERSVETETPQTEISADDACPTVRLPMLSEAQLRMRDDFAAEHKLEQDYADRRESRREINRLNARYSTGPTSPAGKATSSMNAVKSGLTGRTVLLPTDDVAAYEATIARFTERWQPQTDEERVLVQSLADNDWRTQRIPALEYGIYAEGACQFSEDFAGEPDSVIRSTRIQTKTFLTYSRQLMNLQTQDARLRRQREKDEARLQKIQGDRKYEAAKALQQQLAEQPKQPQQPQPMMPTPPMAANPASVGFEFVRQESLADLAICKEVVV